MNVSLSTNMTPEEKRIWIARKLGKDPTRFRFWYNGHDNKRPFRSWFLTREEAEQNRATELKWGCGEVEEYISLASIPDYPNDLNACASMEKALTDEQWHQYRRFLMTIIYPRDRNTRDFTALQRATAFIAVMGGEP